MASIVLKTRLWWTRLYQMDREWAPLIQLVTPNKSELFNPGKCRSIQSYWSWMPASELAFMMNEPCLDIHVGLTINGFLLSILRKQCTQLIPPGKFSIMTRSQSGSSRAWSIEDGYSRVFNILTWLALPQPRHLPLFSFVIGITRLTLQEVMGNSSRKREVKKVASFLGHSDSQAWFPIFAQRRRELDPDVCAMVNIT